MEQAPKPYVQESPSTTVDIVVFDPEGRYDPEQYDRFVNFEQSRDAALCCIEDVLEERGSTRARATGPGWRRCTRRNPRSGLGPSRTWPSRPSPVGCWRGSPRPGRLPPDRCPEEPVLGAFFRIQDQG